MTKPGRIESNQASPLGVNLGVYLESIRKRTATPRKPKAVPTVTADALTQENKLDERPFIVGIGASAGGLEALCQLLPNLPKQLGLSYVVVQHLAPTYRSMMAQLLGRETTMPVRDIEDGTLPEPNTVYITPPNRNVMLHGARSGSSSRQWSRCRNPR